MRILVIEDEEFVRVSLQEFLEEEGHEVVAAADGSAAMLLLDKIQLPHLIITDLSMHPMDGRKFLKHKGQNPILKDIPTIVLTGEPAVTDISEIVLRKPFEAKRLLHAIELSQLKTKI